VTTAAIYLRQSEDVAEGIVRQRDRCTALVNARGWTLGPEFADNDTSASRSRGPGTAWARMLVAARAGRIDVVVAVNLDRLLRTQSDLLALIESGAKVVTLEGELDLASASGEMQAAVLTAMARFEARRKGERQRRANEHRTANGIPVAGKRRYGYLSGNIKPHPEEAPVVLSMFERFRDGASIRSLSKERRWRTGRVRETLYSRAYEGMVPHGGEWLPSEVVVPVVSPELAAEVRDLLANEGRRTSPGAEPRHLLTGIATCGLCGARLWRIGPNYACRETAHLTIRIERAEADIPLAVIHAMGAAPPEPEAPGVGLLLRERVTLLQQLDRAKELYAEFGGADDRARARRLTEDVAQLDARISDAREPVDDLLSEDAQLIVQQVRMLAEGAPIGVKVAMLFNVQDALEAWHALPLLDRRALVRRYLTVTVNSTRLPKPRVEAVPRPAPAQTASADSM
jgi:DNA invertase Pin-like site-specific DNA recombinase